jgi:hypothetical protein
MPFPGTMSKNSKSETVKPNTGRKISWTAEAKALCRLTPNADGNRRNCMSHAKIAETEATRTTAAEQEFDVESKAREKCFMAE